MKLEDIAIRDIVAEARKVTDRVPVSLRVTVLTRAADALYQLAGSPARSPSGFMRAIQILKATEPAGAALEIDGRPERQRNANR